MNQDITTNNSKTSKKFTDETRIALKELTAANEASLSAPREKAMS